MHFHKKIFLPNLKKVAKLRWTCNNINYKSKFDFTEKNVKNEKKKTIKNASIELAYIKIKCKWYSNTFPCVEVYEAKTDKRNEYRFNL